MTMIKYVASMESSGYPMDKLSILIAAKCTRIDNKWQECEIFFTYIGDNVFIPIEQIDMSLLNKVASQVPIYEYGDAVVKPKKSSKQKSVSPTKTNEIDNGKCRED